MKRWMLLSVLPLLLVVAGHAQPAATDQAARLPAVNSPVRLTPDAAACLAVQRSAEIAISEQSVLAARGVLRSAEALRGLQVEGQAAYTRSGPTQSFTLPGENGESTTVDLAPADTHRESLSVTLPLFLGGREKHAKAAAQAGVEAARENVAATRLGIALSARQLIYAVLQLQQLVVVAEQRVTAVAEHRRIAQAMFEAGTAPRFEVVQADTELARARGDLIRAQTAVSQQTALVSQLLYLPQGTEIVIEEGVPAALPDTNLQKLIATAWEQRPELDALQAAVRAQEANLRLAHAYDNPSIALQGSLVNQTASAFSSDLGWSLTVALTKPFYQGGEKQAQVMRAQAALETARLNLERAQAQISTQVHQGLLSVQDAQERLRVAEQGEVEARERLRIAEVRFLNGVSLGVEVLDAQTALQAAQTDVINTRHDLNVAIAALRAALGTADLPKECSS